MSPTHEACLWRAMKQDDDPCAREELIVMYMSYAERVARSVGGPELEDMISEAYLALVECIDKFEPSRGTKFVTLARQRIKGAVIDFLRRATPGARSECPLEFIPVSCLIPEEEPELAENFFPSEGLYLEEQHEAEDSACLGKVLLRMPFSEKCVLLLKLFERLSHEEIALGMGVTTHRTRQLMTMIRKRLRALHGTPEWPWRWLE